MKMQQPNRQEMQEILQRAGMCLYCDAPECHEFTPEGVDVCANLPFWSGKPVTREMLFEWQKMLHAKRAD